MSAVIEREYLSAPQAAELLGIAHEKILRWISTGELIGVDVSTRRGQRPRWRIKRADLDQFLAGRSTSPPPPKPAAQRRRTYKYY